MRDVIVGIASGLIAVLIASALRPSAAQPGSANSSPVVREIPSGDGLEAEELMRRYLPSTRPDAATAKLSRTFAGRDARQMRFDAVLDAIASEAGVNLYVDWRALEAAGINPDARVGVKLADGPASQALATVLESIGGGNIAVRYRTQDGVVRVSTNEELSRLAVTRVYDVSDLIKGGLFHAMAWNDPTRNPTEQEVADALVRVLEDTIDPITWRDAGGTVGGIRYFYGRLVVSQTPENQEAVVGLLGALRSVK